MTISLFDPKSEEVLDEVLGSSKLNLSTKQPAPQMRGLYWSLISFLYQRWCGMRGHEMIWVDIEDEMGLCCLNCLYISPSRFPRDSKVDKRYVG